MIQRIRLPFFRKRNPASELARIGVEKRRALVRATARQICREIGKPIPRALEG